MFNLQLVSLILKRKWYHRVKFDPIGFNNNIINTIHFFAIFFLKISFYNMPIVDFWRKKIVKINKLP